MSAKNTAIGLLVYTLVVGAAVAGATVWAIKEYGPKPEVVTPEPKVLQPDGSVIAERAPVPATPTKPPHKIPRKAKEERRVKVTIQPGVPDCPPVTVNLSTIRDDKGGRRVIASSPDGTVIEALDIPIERVLVPAKPKVWAGGMKYELTDGRIGAWVERDVSILGQQLVLGADINQDLDRRTETWVRVGVRF